MKLAPDNWEIWKTQEMDCTTFLVFATCLSSIVQSFLHFHIITDLSRSVAFFLFHFFNQTNNHFCLSASKTKKNDLWDPGKTSRNVYWRLMALISVLVHWIIRKSPSQVLYSAASPPPRLWIKRDERHSNRWIYERSWESQLSEWTG